MIFAPTSVQRLVVLRHSSTPFALKLARIGFLNMGRPANNLQLTLFPLPLDEYALLFFFVLSQAAAPSPQIECQSKLYSTESVAF